ncbi:cyclin-D1-binding protein 1 [Eublepharis macularius]|uniref:Cyclin-D1-binding protein 1 n=1 Tax=Eublepharis macularius TaxID=481883 RepID=A0AA97JED4_EUBMA|nr:cyclin-D1-binding protein 1 [Eublepharis macularius]
MEAGEAAALRELRAAMREALAGLPGGGEARREGGGGGGGGFERAGVWDALAAACQAASRAATQLSLAASGPARAWPPQEGRGASGAGPGASPRRALLRPQELQWLSGEAQRSVRAAGAACRGLPAEQGRTLGAAVRRAVAGLAEGMLRLSEALLRAPAPESSGPERLVSTGAVWEACERLAGLPRDNQAAVAAAVASALAVVKDAVEEMEQALAEGGDPGRDPLEDEEMGSGGDRDVCWTEAERQLLGPCMGLVKAAKACLKKLLGAVKAQGRVDTAEQVAQLDDLAEAAGDVSPSVDELVLSTYPPVNQLTLRLNAGKLASVLKKVLEIVRASHVCVPSEESWVQFLAGAIDHNMDKIKDFTQGAL